MLVNLKVANYLPKVSRLTYFQPGHWMQYNACCSRARDTHVLVYTHVLLFRVVAR